MTELSMSSGFANPINPSAHELRTWAYQAHGGDLVGLPVDWDLLVADDPLIGTLYELAADPHCPGRRFALHCMYIYAADAIRTDYRVHRKRRLKRLIEQSESSGQEPLYTWAHNVRALQANPELFDYADWCAGGLVRNPRRLR